jgi:hypothetical protein
MDYITPESTVTSGGKIQLGPSGNPLFPTPPIDAIVAGVGLQQLPSCTTGLTSIDAVDPFLGYGKTTSVTTMTPGNFEIVIQKSGVNASTTSLPKAIATEKLSVVTPKVPVRIDSWAPIIE